MRKAIGFNTVVLVMVMVLTSGTAFAGKAITGNATPSGPHWNINIIGHPKGSIGGDYSSGHSIMIPSTIKLANEKQGSIWDTQVAGYACQ